MTRFTEAEPVRVSVAKRFAFPLREGYDYITDLRRWPHYWPNLIRLAPESRWSQPGDTAKLTLKLLGRPVELEMTLTRIDPYRTIEYTSVQRGLPAARHERHFADDRAGFGYRIVVEIEPRGGLRRPFDRLLIPRAVERAARKTVDNLERRFAERSAAGGLAVTAAGTEIETTFAGTTGAVQDRWAGRADVHDHAGRSRPADQGVSDDHNRAPADAASLERDRGRL